MTNENRIAGLFFSLSKPISDAEASLSSQTQFSTFSLPFSNPVHHQTLDLSRGREKKGKKVKRKNMPLQAQPHPPTPAYLPLPGSILHADRTFYRTIATSPRSLCQTFTLPIRSGRAWKVSAGKIIRISTPEGPQVGDLNIWNSNDPREKFWAARTRQLHASHVSTFDRLWSCLPFLRPLGTIIGDSLAWGGGDDGNGEGGYKGGEGYPQPDKWGGRCHDLLGTRCDPYVNRMLSGDSYDFHCHSNLTRAVMEFGLTEFDVHDVLNVFQVTGLDAKGRYFMETCPARKGDFIEIFAEQDLLMALSTCPGGDLSAWGWGEGGEGVEGEEKKSMLECCRPLKVEVFELEDRDVVLKDWKPYESPDYRGRHGMNVPEGEKKN